MKRNPECTLCPISEQQGPAYHRCIWGSGNPKAKLMLIGEAPGVSEAYRGEPFCGQAGDLLNHVLRHLSIERKDLYITNCFKCRPFDNKLPGKKETKAWFEACWPYLKSEIKSVSPKVILLMGGSALSLLTGECQVMKEEGMEVDTIFIGARTFVALHPAYVLRQPSMEVRLAQAIARAADAAGMDVMPLSQVEERFPYEVRD